MRFEHKYSNTFYNYIEKGALRSADCILPLLLSNVNLKSVVDLGCGRGAWLSVFKRFGIKEILGIDGDYVIVDQLSIDKDEFLSYDLSKNIDIPRRYDLAMSLEVAEHIPEKSSDIFVNNLTKLSDVILFSAAVLGQGGEHHINEKPLHFWKDKFESRGFYCYDFIREKVRYNKSVMPWYKFNMLVYANEKGKERLSENVKDKFVPIDMSLSNVQSIPWKIRLSILKYLPTSIVTLIAQLNSCLISIKKV